MNDLSPAVTVEPAQAATVWLDDMLAKAARDRLINAIAQVPSRHSCTIMAAALEDLGAGCPDIATYYSDLRADAAFWADIATPPELEAYAAAALRRLERVAFATAARKRLIVALWSTLPDADRRAFLGAVDPAGKFRGARA